MADPRTFLCGGLLPTAAGRWRRDGLTHLCIGKGPRDAHLRLANLADALQDAIGERAADLLEVAAYVYVADQMVPRGGPSEFEYGARWIRHMRFVIPVRRPDLWERPVVKRLLEDTLGFLSDDEYEFVFVRHPKPTDPGDYLTKGLGAEMAGGDGIEEVVLFSGGLDSLAGAVDEVLVGHRRVALVSHRPVSKVFARQQELVDQIRRRLPVLGRSPLHVALEVNKGKKLNREYTQRTRSFLFAATAAVVAHQLRLPRIRFYENGVTSLNLPLDAELIGARASRTTHPRVLAGFETLFTELFGSPMGVENPYLWRTKAEVIGRIVAAGQADLCRQSCSCAHTWVQSTEHPHCGLCSQCVDRRLSASAAGLEEGYDNPAGYRTDVLFGLRRGADLTYAERYTGAAQDIEGMTSAAEFVARYPQINRALQFLRFPAAEGVERVFDLYRRHATGVCRALDGVIRSDPSILRRQDFPAESLMGMVLGRMFPTAALPTGIAEASRRDEPATGFLVDRTLFEARCGGRACPLGFTIEFRLCERLANTLGRYVSVQTLLDEVWGGRKVGENAVMRAASRLRKRMSDAGIVEYTIDGDQPGHYGIVRVPDPASTTP